MYRSFLSVLTIVILVTVCATALNSAHEEAPFQGKGKLEALAAYAEVTTIGFPVPNELSHGTSDQSWECRFPVTFTRPTEVTDYQVKVRLTPDNFDYSLADLEGDDIRFFNSKGKCLNYWIQGWCPGDTSYVWVKVSESGTSSIYMECGNQFATSRSNGDSTFIFFDGFDGTSVNWTKWQSDCPGRFSVEDGWLTCVGGGVTGYSFLQAIDTLCSDSFTIEQSLNVVSLGTGGCTGFVNYLHGVISDKRDGVAWYTETDDYDRYISFDETSSGGFWAPGIEKGMAPGLVSMTVAKTPDMLQWIVSGSRNFDDIWNGTANNEDKKLGICGCFGGYTVQVDWVHVRASAITDNQPPTALIDSILPYPALPGEEVFFGGSGSDSDGTIISYLWYSSLDDSLSSDSAFSTTSLSEGSHTITFKVEDDDNEWSVEDSAQLFVGEADCVTIGALEVCADAVTPLGKDSYLASGNVRINDILFLNCDLTVDVGNLNISGNGQIEIRNIPDFIHGGTQTIQLWDGAIDYGVDVDALNTQIGSAISSQLQMAGLDAEIESIQLLGDGIGIEGKIVLPQLLKGFKAEVNSISVTQSEGLQLSGQVNVEEVFDVRGLKVENLFLTFDTQQEIFGGGLSVEVLNVVTIEGAVEFYQGMLNQIALSVEVTPGILIDATGLSLTGGAGGVDHIADGLPLIIALSVDITGGPQIGSEYAVKMDDLGVEIEVGGYFMADGTLFIYGQQVAWGMIKYELAGHLLLEFEVSLAGVLEARAWASIQEDLFEGRANATVKIPDDPPWLLKPWAGNVLANAEVLVHSGQGEAWVKGMVWTPEICFITLCGQIQFAFKLEYMGDLEFHLYLGTDYEHLWKIFKRMGAKGEIYQAFEVPPTADEAFFMVKGETGLAPAFELIGPDSTVYDSTQVLLIRVDEDNTAFYKVDLPAPGIWQIHVPNDGGDSLEFDAVSRNIRPSLSFQSPSGKQRSTMIEWIDSDPDNDAEIYLYYDTDNQGFDGILMDSLPFSENDNTDAYSWDVTGVPSGEYYVYAIISDTSTAPYGVYAPGTITVENPDAPPVPSGLGAVTTDSSIQVGWNIDADTMWGYTVFYTEDTGSAIYEQQATVGDTSGVEIFDVTPGRWYKLALRCFDSLGNTSLMSSPILVELVSTVTNNPPYITSEEPPVTAQVGEEYSFTLFATDADLDPVSFLADSVPTGYEIVGSTVSWTPDTSQLGPHRLRILADDGNGGQDTLTYNLFVFDISSSMGMVNLNKGLYIGETEQAIITLSDLDLVDLDSVEVTFSSSSDPTGVAVWLHRTSPASLELTGTAGFSATASSPDPPVVLVAEGDTVIVIYSDANPVSDRIDMGRWTATCCTGIRGNVNGDAGESVNIADLTFLVAYLFGGGVAPPCLEEANVNGDPSEAVNIADLTYLVAYLFGGGPAPADCP